MRSQLLSGVWILLALPAAVACGGSDESTSGSPANPPGNEQQQTELPLGCKHTQFAGDQNCIAAPAPSEGLQLHVGPSNYDDASEVEPYLLPVGEEKVSCFTIQAPNTDTVYYFQQQNRMRPGSHHMIIRIVKPETPLGPGPCESALSGGLGGIPGSQTQVRDIPGVQIAPENEGLGRTLPANAKVQFELHYVNNLKSSTSPLLREAWVNLFYKDKATVTGTIRTIALIGGLGMNIAPHTQTTLHQECDVTADARVFDLFGHFHAHTQRFSAWRTRGGQREKVYESFNWNEPADLVFDTVNKNPAPDATSRSDGGWSGPLDVKAGDVLEWECDVNNTLDTPLRFANQAYTAEMCILFGGYVSDTAKSMTCLR